jgi:hypothetical protein
MIIYLSGPISLNGTATQAEIDDNRTTFAAEAARLRSHGHEVLCPTELPSQPTWSHYMRLCIADVLKADKVVLLPGWERSRGSFFEAEVAHVCGIRIEVA